jgi:hypothetical protein
MNKWESEPDFYGCEAHGLEYVMKRGPTGHWCGYVRVSEGHPWHGRDYPNLDVDVHGGLTYSNAAYPGGEFDGWWFGFDCAHGGDLTPKYPSDGVYRDFEYVKAECESLAKQLAEIGKNDKEDGQ